MVVNVLKKVILIIIATCIMVTGISSCSSEAKKESEDATNGEEVYSIEVYLSSTLKKLITIDEIESLDKVSFSTEDKDEEGPTLTDVLELAGITEFDEVTVVGLTKGRIASAELALSRNEIDDEVILDITNRGTTKLAGRDIPSNDWIIDVSELRVE